MERTISQEERIKRAEEIYYKRKQKYENDYYKKRYVNYQEVKDNKNIKNKIIEKLLKQIALCFMIYLCLYSLVNSNYFFSEDIHKKINEYLTYDINFNELYNTIKKYINDENDILKNILSKNNVMENLDESEGDSNLEENLEEAPETNNEIISEAIGGAEVEEIIEESKTQEELDVEYINNNYGIIWPVQGTITSRYGTRTPTDIVTANHYGLDIGADTGTEIVAAMDGNVTVSSTYGDYGNHVQIENGNVATLYAHCNKLFVSEGDYVTKGQKIAEVGQTRKSNWTAFAFRSEN